MQAGWVSTVLTGNIAANARAKLSAFGLDGLLDLPVGAYGADAEHRPHLVDIARDRIRTARGLPPQTPVVLLGDTPRDVRAGHGAGIKVVGVATGSYAVDELTDAGADWSLENVKEGFPV